MTKLTAWNIYDISSNKSSLNGVMLRGRIRKYGIENNIEVLAENTEDRENGVRFAVRSDVDAEDIESYIKSIIVDSSVVCVMKNVLNPVLSKLKVNDENRYNL